MTIQDLQDGVAQKIQDNTVRSITPAVVREALNMIISYLGSVADQLSQVSQNMATQSNVTSVNASLSSALQSISDLTAAFTTLNSFVMNQPQTGIANLSEAAPVLTLSLGSLNVLGANQSATNQTVNKILAVLRARKDIQPTP